MNMNEVIHTQNRVNRNTKEGQTRKGAPQETWICGDIPDFTHYQLPGFNSPICLGASCGRHGGLAIYLAEGLSYKLIAKSDKTTKIWEGLFVSVTGDNIKKPLIIATLGMARASI